MLLKKPALGALNIFELPKEKKEKFNNFLIANAFANKDKLNTWIYFRQAVDKGVAMEELIGILFWKIKDMLLKKNFSKFSEKQLKTFALAFLIFYRKLVKKVLTPNPSLSSFCLRFFKNMILSNLSARSSVGRAAPF